MLLFALYLASVVVGSVARYAADLARMPSAVRRALVALAVGAGASQIVALGLGPPSCDLARGFAIGFFADRFLPIVVRLLTFRSSVPGSQSAEPSENEGQ